MLTKRLEDQIKKENWWKKDERVLVAVSGGVDSVVLLHLLLELPSEVRPDIYVAHINHQLREVSEEEEAFVLRLCRDNQVPVFTTKWTEGLTISSNVEQQARQFRYSFFDEVMKRQKITKLLTAHHEDDQVETMMMRLINGNRVKSITGMKEIREFGQGELIRPLLQIKKEELALFAKENNLFFYEDESNQSLDYLRNRLRHQLLPTIKKENPKFNEHMMRFREELEMSTSLIEETVKPKYNNCVTFDTGEWQIDRQKFISCTQKEQYFILEYLMDSLKEKENIVIGFKQKEQLHANLLSEKPNQGYFLKKDWYVTRLYDDVTITKKKEEIEKEISFDIALNQGVFLSDTEWFGFFEVGKEEIPSTVKSWLKKEMLFSDRQQKRLIIRKKRPGDRLLLNEKGQTKKVSRYFIDEKIPTLNRKKSWVVEDHENIVKWLVPFRESYLSIRDETDKIQYKLVYFYAKDE